MIDRIECEEKLLALIVRDAFREPGVHFVTPDYLSQQLAYMRHPAGKKIEPHIHNPVPREVLFTQEVLFIKKGKLRVDFYGDDRKYLRSEMLGQGDTLLLIFGGHGFEAVEEVEMIEVKQGPHAGDLDKSRFVGISAAEAVVGGGESAGSDYDRKRSTETVRSCDNNMTRPTMRDLQAQITSRTKLVASPRQ